MSILCIISQVKNQELLGVLPLQLELRGLSLVVQTPLPLDLRASHEGSTFRTAVYQGRIRMFHSLEYTSAHTYNHACFAMSLKFSQKLHGPMQFGMAIGIK
jgi:hypothetical protein